MQFIRYVFAFQHFRNSVLGESNVTDSIGQTLPDTRCSSGKGTAAKSVLLPSPPPVLDLLSTCTGFAIGAALLLRARMNAWFD